MNDTQVALIGILIILVLIYAGELALSLLGAGR